MTYLDRSTLLPAKNVTIAFICLLLLWPAVCTAAKDQTQPLKERVEELEKRLNLVREFEGLSDQLKKDIEEEFEAIGKRYEQDIMKLWIVALVILAGGLLSIWKIFWSIPRKAEARIDKKIDAFFQEKIGSIKALIESQEVENRIRDTKRILILGDTEDQALGMREHFRQLQFKFLFPKQFKEVYDLEKRRMARDFDENEFDLIVFSEMNEAEIDRYMDVSVKEHFIGYTLLDKKLKVRHRERITFANSPFTLYGRTMEALKYQYIMEKTL